MTLNICWNVELNVCKPKMKSAWPFAFSLQTNCLLCVRLAVFSSAYKRHLQHLWHHKGWCLEVMCFSAFFLKIVREKWVKLLFLLISEEFSHRREVCCLFSEFSEKLDLQDCLTVWLFRHLQTSLVSSVSHYSTVCLCSHLLFLLLLLKYRLLISHIT